RQKVSGYDQDAQPGAARRPAVYPGGWSLPQSKRPFHGDGRGTLRDIYEVVPETPPMARCLRRRTLRLVRPIRSLAIEPVLPSAPITAAPEKPGGISRKIPGLPTSGERTR